MAQGELVWIHMHEATVDTEAALQEFLHIPRSMTEFLLLRRIRPRVQQRDDNLLVVLRGINLNPESDPEDMVSPRTWISPTCIVTNRVHRVMAYQTMREDLDEGSGVRSAGEFLVHVTKLLTFRIREHLETIDSRLDDLEDEILDTKKPDPIGALAQLRREMIALRRYLHPQRTTLEELCVIKAPWLDDLHRADLTDAAKKVINRPLTLRDV